MAHLSNQDPKAYNNLLIDCCASIPNVEQNQKELKKRVKTSRSQDMVLGLSFSLQNDFLNITGSENGTNLFIESFTKTNARSATVLLTTPSNDFDSRALVLESFRVLPEFLTTNQNFASYASKSGDTSSIALASIMTNSTSMPLAKNQLIPVFEMVVGAITYLVIIAMTVIGNILVVVAVFSYRPLKKVQNYFLVSLAASDLAVALIVMPLHVVKFLADGRWLLGVALCQIFTTADILLCTSSIWNLCAIALDRYFAIHYPINYAQKRTPNFVCSVIALVWLVSIVISVPPLIGWNDWSSQKLMDHCELTTEKAFVVYSASGSFFVPLLLMVVVYLKIFISARQRIRTNRGRSALLKISKQPPQNSSEFVVPSCTLTPMVCATTASVAHILHHQKLKNKFKRNSNCNNIVDTNEQQKRQNLRSFSQSVPHNALDGKSFFLSERNARSNSSCALTSLPISQLIAVTKTQKQYAATNNGLNHNSVCKETETLTTPANNDSLSSGNLQQNGGESMFIEETTTTIKSEDNNLPNTPISPLLKTPLLPKLQNHTRFNNKMSTLNGSVNDCGSGSGGGVEEQLTTTVLKNREKISVAKEKRAAKTIAVIIFVFTFCWMPFFCVYVILPFCETCYLHPKVHQAVVWLGYINSSLNPFLYGILNLEFRRAFRKILCPKRFLNSRQKHSMAKR